MSEVLTVCRLGPDWAVKTRQGAFYGRSPERERAEAEAKKLAAAIGDAVIVVSDEQGSKRARGRSSGRFYPVAGRRRG